MKSEPSAVPERLRGGLTFCFCTFVYVIAAFKTLCHVSCGRETHEIHVKAVNLVDLSAETAEDGAMLNHSTLGGVAVKTYIKCKINVLKGRKCIFTDLCKKPLLAFP